MIHSVITTDNIINGVIESKQISIGRNGKSDIQLSDPSIGFDHAVIKPNGSNQLQIHSQKADLQIEGNLVQAAFLAANQEIKLGPYELHVKKLEHTSDGNFKLELSIMMVDKPTSAQLAPSAGKYKWWTTGGLSILIALFFLLLPLANIYHPIEGFEHAISKLLKPAQSLNAHRNFSNECKKCHETPLTKIQDKTCTNCHLDLKTHVEDSALGGELKKEAQCINCHSEHKENQIRKKQDDASCINCHKSVTNTHLKTKSPNISDFATDHAAFSKNNKQRLLTESETKFPHSQHFDKVQGPDGIYDVRVLQCANCHASKAPEKYFEKISFEKHCIQCHKDKNETKFSQPKPVNQPKFPHANYSQKDCQHCHDDKNIKESESISDIEQANIQTCRKCHAGIQPIENKVVSSCTSCHRFHTHKVITDLTSNKSID